MKFYEKYYPGSFEELITYYPRYYRDVFEMVEILKAHGRIADGIEENIEQAYLNGFIDYADEATIAKLEGFLDIGLNRSRALEERRRLVKSCFVGFGKMSATKIKEMVRVFTDIPVDVEFVNIIIVTFIISHSKAAEELERCIEDVQSLLGKKLPAHLPVSIIYENPLEGDVFIGGVMCEADILEMSDREVG